MWFLIGLCFVVVASACIAYVGVTHIWKGIPGEVDGLAYIYNIREGKLGLQGFFLGVEATTGYDYAFKRETGFDRFFKKMGLSKEFQSGDEDFDNLIYVLSDNKQLHRQIVHNAEIREAIQNLFKLESQYNFKLKEVRHRAGRLWIKIAGLSEFRKEDIPKVASTAVPVLKTVSESLIQSQSRSLRWKDPFIIRSVLLLSLSAGLLANGLIHLVRVFWIDIPFTMDQIPLFVDALSLTAVIVVMFLIAVLLLLGRSSRAHIVLLEVLLIGGIGAFATSLVELRDLNIEWDNSPGQEFDLVLENKKIHRRRRATSYNLYVTGWLDSERREKITVSSEFYDSLKIGDRLRLVQREGYLGYRWVEALEKIKSH
ncbi:MAG: hypothetical protein OEZ23_05065 [Gammaproteobacteria bacterium]|nr:hypothetical protein [Gammaproteobacteria bacterium]